MISTPLFTALRNGKGAMICALARSSALSHASSASVVRAMESTAPVSRWVSARNAMARVVMSARRINVITNATPRSGCAQFIFTAEKFLIKRCGTRLDGNPLSKHMGPAALPGQVIGRLAQVIEVIIASAGAELGDRARFENGHFELHIGRQHAIGKAVAHAEECI